MEITFKLETAEHQEKETLLPEDQLRIIKDALCEGFRVPEEAITLLKVQD